jgi:hypothetical protein
MVPELPCCSDIPESRDIDSSGVTTRLTGVFERRLWGIEQVLAVSEANLVGSSDPRY